jgi:hypothetical protein
MSLERAWHVAPTAGRARVQKDGIVPDVELGETEVWLMARESWARALAEETKDVFRETPDGYADIWLVDLRGLDVYVYEHIQHAPSVVIRGSVEAHRLTLAEAP